MLASERVSFINIVLNFLFVPRVLVVCSLVTAVHLDLMFEERAFDFLVLGCILYLRTETYRGTKLFDNPTSLPASNSIKRQNRKLILSVLDANLKRESTEVANK